MTHRAACGVTPEGAALAARQSRFRGALTEGTSLERILSS